MKKILILKNDRVGDLFNSLEAINLIIKNNSDASIEIVLSEISKNLDFLFNLNHVKVSYLPYHLTFYDKLKIVSKIIKNSFNKIYILSPKNFYFYLPLISKSKFYAISIKNSNKSRPSKFLSKKLFKNVVNDRENKKIKDNISSLLIKLCSNGRTFNQNNVLNHNPILSDLFIQNIGLFSNFIHFHYKDNIFNKNGWDFNKFLKLLENLSNNYKIILTSDFGNFQYHKKFLEYFSNLNFDNSVNKINLDKKIHYLHNINTSDLFKLVSMSNTVISPHGAMTVMGSYLNKKVIDIFDTNIDIMAFREYKPINSNYNFFIIKPDFKKILYKIRKFL